MFKLTYIFVEVIIWRSNYNWVLVRLLLLFAQFDRFIGLLYAGFFSLALWNRKCCGVFGARQGLYWTPKSWSVGQLEFLDIMSSEKKRNKYNVGKSLVHTVGLLGETVPPPHPTWGLLSCSSSPVECSAPARRELSNCHSLNHTLSHCHRHILS